MRKALNGSLARFRDIVTILFIVVLPVHAGSGGLDLIPQGNGDGVVADLMTGNVLKPSDVSYGWGGNACLEAVPAPGSAFKGWDSGDCKNTGSICVLIAQEEMPYFRTSVRFEKDPNQEETAPYYPKDESAIFFEEPGPDKPLRKELLNLVREPVEKALSWRGKFIVRALPTTESAALAYLRPVKAGKQGPAVYAVFLHEANGWTLKECSRESSDLKRWRTKYPAVTPIQFDAIEVADRCLR